MKTVGDSFLAGAVRQTSQTSIRHQSFPRRPKRLKCSRAVPARLPSRANKALRDQLVTFFPLVKQTALEIRRNLPPQVEVEDLIGDGMIGLVEAASKFNAAKQVSFKGYARHRIRGAILDGLRKEDRASRSLRRKIRRMDGAAQKLATQLGRPATGDEMALELGLSLEQWNKMTAEAQRVTVAPVPLLETLDEGRLPQEPSADGDSPFEVCYRNEQKRILASSLQCLEEREREMIRLYYFQTRTMKQVGAALGVDESRISQLHSRAIRRLRECVQAIVMRGEAAGPPATLPIQAISP